ncbi:(2Fe-2S)-binding protein [Zunongwangia sp. F260]|jgi:nicotinate dehydrogenase subunit A|uniref:(2Fe-2S)-binding protein n=2 Tax=Autumnicola TaxID=3160927 RepID=A0ABU3CGN4_9FLAO|nr:MULTISPECIES: 2Fe-2S iron-sulfur cluster-binding protein [unclassified Zunongwangia]MDT0645512.1 (2Fe-2S)-binding protein [Zunongwangia sp. F260]MDT0686336.1 (2Fe-2S)-binding protein [Zunongwangia sp. F225]
MKTLITLRVNGKEHEVNVDPQTPLLYVLRNNLGLKGPKFGCGLSQCGACMVLFDGKANPSCLIAVERAAEMEITTLEGLADENGNLHKVQQAFVEEQAAQCGYCLNGLVMASVGLLNEKPNPSDKEIQAGLYRNICRCGVHARVIRAVKKASAL